VQTLLVCQFFDEPDRAPGRDPARHPQSGT
jgi:hypothetical protein